MLLRWLVAHHLRREAGRVVETFVRGALDPTAARPAAGELPPAEWAVVFGTAPESGGLVDLLQESVTTHGAAFVEHVGAWQGGRVVVAETGEGPQRTQQAVADLIAVHRPRWVIAAGFASSLSEAVRRGHLVIADIIADQHGATWPVARRVTSESVAGQRGLHVGRLLTVDEMVRTSAERRQLAAKHPALACDQESSGVAAACQAANVPLLAVRIVTDELDEELPPAVARYLSQGSVAGKLGYAAAALFRRPAVLQDLWHLRDEARKASDRLAKFLGSFVSNLRAT